LSTTFGTLKTRLSLLLQDPDRKTFTEPLVEELIFAGLVEVGRLAPEQFTEDLTPVAGQLVYALRSADFVDEAVPEIELTRVEVWDPTQTPDAFIAKVPEAGLENTTADSGWSVWGGELHLPTMTVRGLDSYVDDYVIRVKGYSPYVQPDDDADVLAISKEVESALLDYSHLEAVRMLLASRNLFTQWQTRSGNTDMSPAGLMNEKNILTSEWRQKSRAISRLRARV
jgi:hypothetical protein